MILSQYCSEPSSMKSPFSVRVNTEHNVFFAISGQSIPAYQVLKAASLIQGES